MLSTESCGSCASRSRDGGHVQQMLRPRAAGLLVGGVAAVAALAAGLLGPWLNATDLDPADVRLRASFGVIWMLLQVASLACVYVASRAGFGLICGIAMVVGLTAMSIGRSGV